MINHPSQIDRRMLLWGLGATCVLPGPVLAQTRTTLSLEATAGTIELKAGQPPTPVWQLIGGPAFGPLRFRRGETVDVTLTNRLPVPVAMNWIGLDGAPPLEPMTGQPALAPDASVSYPVTFRHAGTMLADLWPIENAPTRQVQARAVIVSETETLAVDRDEVLLLADWRAKTDGSATTAGVDSAQSSPTFTVNGVASWDFTASLNQRLRLRIINSSQIYVIAIKISDYDTRIIAIDGQPSEPFPARDGLLVLAPGTRIDAVIDVTRPAGSVSAITLLNARESRSIGRIVTSNAEPSRAAALPFPSALPSNGLPTQLDLKSALRVDLSLNATGAKEWLSLVALASTAPPAFRIKRGRPAVLALTNRGETPAVVRLHGHHFRLLDRLDDGWKPFWLDTLAVAAGQTQRIVFLAEFAGLYPIELKATDGTSPRQFRTYLVE